MAIFKTASFLDADDLELIQVIVRVSDTHRNAGLANLEGVQPSGANRQGVFGSGVRQAGTWERLVSVCGLDAYASPEHAMAALDEAVRLCRAVECAGWRLPIAGGVGIAERSLRTQGFLALVRLIPASAHWRFVGDEYAKTGTGSQAGTVLTLQGLDSGDVGRLVVFADGREALITSVSSATAATADVEQTVSAQAFEILDAATGLI